MDELLKIACPNCAKSLKVKSTAIGKKVKCPGCATAFVAGDDGDGDFAGPVEEEQISRTAESEDWKKATKMTTLVGVLITLVCVIGPIIQTVGMNAILAEQGNQPWARSRMAGSLV